MESNEFPTVVVQRRYTSSKREIALGTFWSDFFRDMEIKNRWLSYDFGQYNPKVAPEFPVIEYRRAKWSGILSVVWKAGHYYSKINFLLDSLKTPIELGRYITSDELRMVLDTPELLQKTVFWLKGEVIPTEKVLKVMSGEVLFDNIDFSSL